MKKTLLTLAAFAAFSGSAFAADTQAVGVSANVSGNCKFTAAAPVAFGNLDPAAAGTVTAAGSVTFWCTKGTSYTLAANNGSNALVAQKRMKGPGATDFIPYTLVLAATSGTGAGKTAPITVAANGSVDSAAFQDASAGAYTDSVTVNVTP